MADAKAPLVSPGDVLDGKYRVERILGQGGMGMVVRALHLQLRDYVAIKFLLPSAMDDERARMRFLREARACARLRNEHIVRVLDFGMYENGAPIIVMEYLEGTDLARHLVAKRWLSCEATVDYVLQACEGIAEAHAYGLVHRDLKPSNLFLTSRSDGTSLVKVLDFGASKFVALAGTCEASAKGITASNTMIGSPEYMSPEQISGEGPLDARSDIWALGVIVFELLAGRVPFFEESVVTTFASVLRAEPPSLRALRPDIPEELDALVAWCLQKEPKDRCPDVATFAAKLVEAVPSAQGILGKDRVARLAHSVPSRVIADIGVIDGEAGPDDSMSNTSVTAWKRTVVARRSVPVWSLAVATMLVMLSAVWGASKLLSVRPSAVVGASSVVAAKAEPLYPAVSAPAPAHVASSPSASASFVPVSGDASASARPLGAGLNKTRRAPSSDGHGMPRGIKKPESKEHALQDRE